MRRRACLRSNLQAIVFPLGSLLAQKPLCSLLVAGGVWKRLPQPSSFLDIQLADSQPYVLAERALETL